MELLTKDEFEKFVNEIKFEIDGLKYCLSSPYNKKIFKNKELKEYLGCSYSTLEKMRSQNIIPYKKVMGNYYYDIDEVNKVFMN